MANSSKVSVGQRAEADQYNNLWDDVMHETSGHDHTGVSGKGTKIPNSGLATASSGPTASYVMLRDTSGRSQVEAPAADDDIVNLETVKDLRQVDSSYVTPSYALTTSFADITGASFSITTVRPCTILVFYSLQESGLEAGFNYRIQAVVGSTTSTEYHTYGYLLSTGSGHFFFSSVSAGTMAVKLQAMKTGGSGGTISAVRVSAIVIPTS